MSGSNVSSEREPDTEPVLECVDCLDPADAFALVGNETRLSILRALWAADERPVSFSELRREVGMTDSAQFNYHLQELTGHFVTQGEDGYTFKHAGEKVVRSVIAGSFNEQPTLEPFPVEGACIDCDGPLQAVYEDERLGIECRDCGQCHGEYAFPPGGLNDRTHGEIADAFDQRVRHLHCLAADGVCPECSGRMESRIVEHGDCCLGVELRVDHECAQCGHTLCSAAGLRLLDHSAVVSFHRDRGVALDERPYWTLPWCVADEHTRIVERDPYRLEVRIPLEGDLLRVRLDEGLNVLETSVELAE
ncbi:winged helix-turn-helix domain-containing protein [Natronobacterium texcoconense]|uniref:Helix-turn-helix domain-containing protein n=1 Tax=Natronobacterium texcoconense TaxID=1095778 RepID=A0A1H1IPH6_NATTX|nr:helix-turn-helix domain-containing protein [Natronobacterium texcoconense]SDR39520.1 Helix-turn-helix domain-containing protein [Natronobacterium texcoconense]